MLILLMLLTFNIFANVLLIDPGHGGEAMGAIGRDFIKVKGKRVSRNTIEKDLALSYAKELKKYLDKQVTVFLTRSHDRSVSLEERAAMANELKADLVISLHFNSSTSPSYNGFELYYLDNHKDGAVEKLEKVENFDYVTKTANDDINKILLDIVIKKTVYTSKRLANEIHQQSKSVLKSFGIKDRGVKPGLFHVLALSQRPGVLIEFGFISNLTELKKLRSEKYKKQITQAVGQGIMNYLAKEKKISVPLF